MKVSKQDYGQYVKEMSPNSPMGKDVFNAFWIGGLICVIGQLILSGFQSLGLDTEDAGTATSIVMVFLGALLTGLSVYDDIAKHAGAGTLVPITGFANGVAAPAIEYKSEGQVFGIGCKIFTIAGPVILYGVFSSWALGIIYWLLQL